MRSVAIPNVQQTIGLASAGLLGAVLILWVRMEGASGLRATMAAYRLRQIENISRTLAAAFVLSAIAAIIAIARLMFG